MKKAKIIAVVTLTVLGTLLAFAAIILKIKGDDNYLYPRLDLPWVMPALLLLMMLFAVVYSASSVVFFTRAGIVGKTTVALILLFFFLVFLMLSNLALIPVLVSKTDDTAHFARIDADAEDIIDSDFDGVLDFDNPTVSEYHYSFRCGDTRKLEIRYKVTLTEDEYRTWVEMMVAKNDFTIEETDGGYSMNLSFGESPFDITGTGSCSIECDSTERTVSLALEYVHEL